jgi:DNA modification methylase
MKALNPVKGVDAGVVNVQVVLFRKLVNEIPTTTYATHGLYMYPAKFIPQVVRYIINKYTKPGDWLFDPFAGYGTVAIESTITGRNCVVWDLNPILYLLVTASLYNEPIHLRDLYVDFNHFETFHPRWSNIAYWHPPEFYNTLSRAWGYWHKNVEKKLKPLVAIPLLKVTRYFSYSDEKIAKLYRSKYAEEKVKRLLNSDWKSEMEKMYWGFAREVVEKVSEYQRYNPQQVKVIVKTSYEETSTGKYVIVDSIKEKLDREVDVLITSPPYLQAQEYIRSFKLELAWLGFSGNFISLLSKYEIPYNNVKEGYISSKTYEILKREIEKINHNKLLELFISYFNSLALFLNNNHDKIRNIIAFFVGPVKIRNMRIPIDTILKEHLEYLGWAHEITLIDTIISRRLFKSEVNPATGLEDERTPTEHLLIMRRRI